MLALLLTMIASAEPELAVVDLSRKPAPALAEALRKSGDATPLSASTTKQAVADAASLGLRCGAGDIECLEKLLVLLRVKKLLAFAVRGTVVAVTLVGDGPARQARVQLGRNVSSGATAREVWRELRAPVAPPPLEDEREEEDEQQQEPPPPREEVSPEVTPTATSGGLTTGVVLGIAGAAGTLLFGAAAVGVSAELARQEEATQRGIPLEDSYDEYNTAFLTLSACTLAALATSVVGIGLSLSEP